MEQRSTLVTVVGWIFIVLSGLFLLESLMFLFMPMDRMFANLPQQPGQPRMDPALLGAFMHGMGIFFFLVTSWVLISSIGLVRRKSWARISFLVMLGLGIAWNALYLLIGIFMVALGGHLPQQPGAPDMSVLSHFIGIFMLVWGGGFVALFGWLMYVLNTERIHREFQPAAPASGTP